ncbi:MAG TPA: methionine--tRNA ligase, partial [Bacteroidales bacterium]|nr:methionine--tRNA ligase [Bacteroidales bacterium]
AYGDQCESCGTSLSPRELINPVSVISGNKPELRKTKHWYLPLDQYEEWLTKWILEGHKDDWKSNVYGQVKSWIDTGLKPRAVTRDLDWGVKVPVEGAGAEGKVLYVWFDAPIGYISATKEWAQERNIDWKPYWKDEETKLVHFIGKDNIVFHCIIFPVMLKAEGSYILPDNVPANEFLNLENDKISTSRNWAVWLHEYLQEFPGKQDALRYVLTANAPEAKDNDFTWKDYQARNNNELLAILGNFVNRSMVLTKKYYDGKMPNQGTYTQEDKQISEEVRHFPERITEKIEKYRFREALNEMMALARLGNKYLTDNEPWKLQKTDPERVKTIMNLSLQICANLSTLAEPFIPFTAIKLREMLNIPEVNWKDTGRLDLIPEGHQFNKPELLFEKVEDEVVEAQKNKLIEARKANEKAEISVSEAKENIGFEDFMKMDIR